MTLKVKHSYQLEQLNFTDGFKLLDVKSKME